MYVERHLTSISRIANFEICVKEPLSSVSEHDLNMLYKRYELDYQAFGYTVDHSTLEIGGWEV